MIKRISILLLLLFIASCGRTSGKFDQNDTTPLTCQEMYSQEFCDSIRGEDGESITGAEGLSGENGINGIDGEDAEPCTVVGVLDEDTGDTGALITCPTSQAIVWDGVEGEDGSDAILEVIDPCGKETTYDEVLFRLSDGNIYAVYAHIKGNKYEIMLTQLINSWYITTDGTDCNFNLFNGEVTW